MIRRLLLGAALIGAAFAGLDCNQIFGLDPVGTLHPNTSFAGCFRGPVTEPAGPAVVTIVFEAPPEALVSLTGCMQGIDPRFDATLAGGVNEEKPAEAIVTVMPQGRQAFALTVERKPSEGFGNAETVTLVNDSGFPFKRAVDLPRCSLTCADLELGQSLVPGGGQ